MPGYNNFSTANMLSLHTSFGKVLLLILQNLHKHHL